MTYHPKSKTAKDVLLAKSSWVYHHSRCNAFRGQRSESAVRLSNDNIEHTTPCCYACDEWQHQNRGWIQYDLPRASSARSVSSFCVALFCKTSGNSRTQCKKNVQPNQSLCPTIEMAGRVYPRWVLLGGPWGFGTVKTRQNMASWGSERSGEWMLIPFELEGEEWWELDIVDLATVEPILAELSIVYTGLGLPIGAFSSTLVFWK